ncbi:spore germination protein, partial [Bacillus sp. FDAARGOS_235]|uniref:spore germination protein n=1 Tax=Bacillus sp. FDAARGOS_235 TaxID=1839798 RepID=UPI0011A1D0B5
QKSIFPLYVNTQPTDTLTKPLIHPKIPIFLHPSPTLLLTPLSYFHFFISPQHYNLSSLYPTFSTILTLIPLLFSISPTPLYLPLLN